MLVLAIAHVRCPARTIPTVDHGADVISTIDLAPEVPDDALLGLGAFSYIEIIYLFHQV